MTFLTQLQAIDPKTGDLCVWVGPNIEADNWEDAERQSKSRGYLQVVGIDDPYCNLFTHITKN